MGNYVHIMYYVLVYALQNPQEGIERGFIYDVHAQIIVEKTNCKKM